MAKLNLFGCWVLYELAAHSPTHVTDLAMVGHVWERPSHIMINYVCKLSGGRVACPEP